MDEKKCGYSISQFHRGKINLSIKTIYWSVGCLTILGWTLGGCQQRGRAIDLGEGFEVIYVEDPDPEQDNNLPRPCNPSGKTGAQLQSCLNHNEQIYEPMDREAIAREPWYRFSNDNWLSVVELDSKFVFPVSNVEGAIEKLETVSIVELSPKEAASLTRKSDSFQDKKPYLVRGLAIDPVKGHFNVYLKNDALLVMHQSIGESVKNETRLPIVVWLPQKPARIYIDCQVSVE